MTHAPRCRLKSPAGAEHAGALDIVRAACVLWIVCAHMIPWTNYYEIGHPAPEAANVVAGWLVAVFQPAGETHPAILILLVLSGYLIHGRHFVRADRAEIAPYAIGRMFRILPVLIVGALAGALAFEISLSSRADRSLVIGGTREISFQCMLAKLTGMSALFPPLTVCAFQGNAPLNSVQAVVWLYVAYPFMIFVVAERLGRCMWGCVAAVWAGGSVAIALYPSLSGWWQTSSAFGFLSYWWIGAAAAESALLRRLRAGRWWLVLAWAALTAAELAWPFGPIGEVRKLVFAGLCASLLAGIARFGRRSSRLSWLGMCAYSIYAFHTPVAHLMMVVYRAPLWTTLLMAVLVGITAAVLLEGPSARLGRALALRLRGQDGQRMDAA